MKKLILISFLLLNILSTPTYAINIKTSSCIVPISNEYSVTPHSTAELYKDMLVAVLYPSIANSVKEYYGRELLFDLASIEFVDIKRPLGYQSFEFIAKLQIKPFEGAHNVVGIDMVTIKIKEGVPSIEKFEHVKTFKT